MADDYRDQTAQNALDERVQALQWAGYGIISGGDVSAAGGFDVTVTQTEAFFAGATATTGAQNKSLQQYVADEPRKVLVCITQTGSISVETGNADPEPADPPDEIRANANRPAPPDLAGRTDVIPLMEVWVGANTTAIDDNDLFHDRRPTPDIRVRELVAAGVTADRIIDGANVAHESELADLADVRTNADIEAVINDDPDHGSRTAGIGAFHDFWTASDTLQTVNDEAELTVDIAGDANTLDGLHARDFAEVGHNHDNQYLEDQDASVAESNLDFDPFTYSEYLDTLGEVVATSDETLTGGTNPALRATLEDTTSRSNADLDVEVRVPSPPGFAADFGYSKEHAQTWDDSVGAWDVEVTVSWDTNPGAGNDVPVVVDVIERGDRTEPLPPGSDTGSFSGDHADLTNVQQNQHRTSQEVASALDGQAVNPSVVNSQELSVTDSGTLNNVYVADPTASDIGAEIQSIHDNQCDNGDTIFVPPGEYHNQQTPIILSKWVSLESVGRGRNPGAKLYKQGDFVALTVTHTDRPSSKNTGEGGHVLTGIEFNGADAAGSSVGVRIHSVVEGNFKSWQHGSHGVFVEHADDDNHNSNWLEITVDSSFNGGDGVRVEQTAGSAINLNDMDLNMTCRGNTNAGCYHRDGYDNNLWGDSEGNGGKGWDLGGDRLFCVLRNEQNGANSTLTAMAAEVVSKSFMNRWDHAQTPNTSIIRRGDDYRGEPTFSAVSETYDTEPALTRRVVYKTEDTDTTTPLSFDTGALPTHKEFRVRAVIGGHGSGGAMEFKGQINNNTTANYDYATVGNGTIGSVADNTYWADEIWSAYQSTIDWDIRSGQGVASVGIGPTIRANSTTSVMSTSLIDHGRFASGGEFPVESIQLSTDVNAVGTVVIEGVDY